MDDDRIEDELDHELSLHDRFIAHYEALLELYEERGTQYGHTEDPNAGLEAFVGYGIPRWVGGAVMAGVKAQRLKTLIRTRGGAWPAIEDTLRDMAVYALITLAELDQAKAETERIATGIVSRRGAAPRA